MLIAILTVSNLLVFLSAINSSLTRGADLVASMWTSYRQCQLHLADLICRLNASLSGSLTYSQRELDKLQREIRNYIDETFASVPFMLAADSIHHCQPNGAVWQLPKTPILLGGLNMQWILFTISTLENAPKSSKLHARETLLWFAETLGIGQAKVLANVRASWLDYLRNRLMLSDVSKSRYHCQW
jgi:hypothetical protein